MTIKRIAFNAVNPDLRGQLVMVTGYRSATHWDRPRVEVRLIESDGSLSAQSWLVTPQILIDDRKGGA